MKRKQLAPITPGLPVPLSTWIFDTPSSAEVARRRAALEEPERRRVANLGRPRGGRPRKASTSGPI